MISFKQFLTENKDGMIDKALKLKHRAWGTDSSHGKVNVYSEEQLDEQIDHLQNAKDYLEMLTRKKAKGTATVDYDLDSKIREAEHIVKNLSTKQPQKEHKEFTIENQLHETTFRDFNISHEKLNKAIKHTLNLPDEYYDTMKKSVGLTQLHKDAMVKSFVYGNSGDHDYVLKAAKTVLDKHGEYK